MPAEDPQQFELNTLRSILTAIDQPIATNNGLWCGVFGGLGILLLIIVYGATEYKFLSGIWLFFMCFMSGLCIGGAAIINRLSNQNKIAIQYLDREAIAKRIDELKM